jgi:dynein heavy chain
MEFDIEKRQCFEGPFLKLNFSKIEKRINQEFYRNSIQLTKALDDLGNENAQKVAAEFKKDIEKFREKLWLIELLTTEALVKKPAYWKEIAKECNVDSI